MCREWLPPLKGDARASSHDFTRHFVTSIESSLILDPWAIARSGASETRRAPRNADLRQAPRNGAGTYNSLAVGASKCQKGCMAGWELTAIRWGILGLKLFFSGARADIAPKAYEINNEALWRGPVRLSAVSRK